VAQAGQIDLLDPNFKANPYPTYAKLRSEAPAARVTLPDGREGWLFTRYEDVEAILRDHEQFTNRSFLGQIEEGPELPPRVRGVYMLFNEIMLGKDPPEHTRLRKLVQKAFTARLVEGLRPNIQELADNLLDAVEERARRSGERKMDLIADYAFPIPVTIIMDLLGIPYEDRENIRSWSTTLASFDGSLALAEKIAPEVNAFIDYLGDLLEAKRKNPRDDLLTNLVLVEDEGDRLNDADLLAMVYVLIFAGHETTLHLIGNGTLALLTHPEQFEKLKADPSLIKTAVEELLRYDPSVEIPRARLAVTDVEIGGVLVRRGEVVLTAIAGANHDPGRFEASEELNISRENNRHLSFGKGIHACLGASLARLEGQIAIGTLVGRMPNLKLAVPPEELRWRPGGIFLRGLAALPVTF
jgi:cytochrome P450